VPAADVQRAASNGRPLPTPKAGSIAELFRASSRTSITSCAPSCASRLQIRDSPKEQAVNPVDCENVELNRSIPDIAVKSGNFTSGLAVLMTSLWFFIGVCDGEVTGSTSSAGEVVTVVTIQASDRERWDLAELLPHVQLSYLLAAVCAVIILTVARPCVIMAAIPLCVWGYFLVRLLTFLLALLGGVAFAMLECLQTLGGSLLQMLLIGMLLWLSRRSCCMQPLVQTSMSWVATILAVAWSLPSRTAWYEPTVQDPWRWVWSGF